MSCWRNILMITGTRMAKNFRCMDRAAQDSFIHGLGEHLRGNKQPQDPTMYGQICGSISLMQRNARRGKKVDFSEFKIIDTQGERCLYCWGRRVNEDTHGRVCSGQGMGKIGENFGFELDKSEVNQRWSRKQGRRTLQFILHHWWTYVIWKMQNWRQSTKNTKVELYSEVILWKTTQGLTQYSLTKDLYNLKWQSPKVMDIISRLPGCAGQAADAVFACTQVKMEHAAK